MLRQKIHVFALLFAFILPSLALARAESYTFVETFPINFVTEGCEELIELSGQIHSVSHITFDNSGGFHLVTQTNPQGVTGVGLVTGSHYQGTGVERFNINGQVGEETTAVLSFKLIGRGPTDNYLVQQTFHITVNANGEVTAVADNSFVKCQG